MQYRGHEYRAADDQVRAQQKIWRLDGVRRVLDRALQWSATFLPESAEQHIFDKSLEEALEVIDHAVSRLERDLDVDIEIVNGALVSRLKRARSSAQHSELRNFIQRALAVLR